MRLDKPSPTDLKNIRQAEAVVVSDHSKSRIEGETPSEQIQALSSTRSNANDALGTMFLSIHDTTLSDSDIIKERLLAITFS